MSLIKSHIIPLSLSMLTIAYILGVLFKWEMLQTISRAFIFPLFVVLYFVQTKKKAVFFAGFLILFSLAEVLILFDFENSNFKYYMGNTMYILAYCALTVYFITRINFFVILKRFKIFLFALLFCSSYMVYMLNEMILNDPIYQLRSIDFLIKGLYNISILMVLSFSLLNYLYHDSKEDLLLFLATACIVFSEMVNVANFYIAEAYLLDVIYALLFSVGFLLVYIYITSKINTYYRVLF